MSSAKRGAGLSALEKAAGEMGIHDARAALRLQAILVLFAEAAGEARQRCVPSEEANQ